MDAPVIVSAIGKWLILLVMVQVHVGIGKFSHECTDNYTCAHYENQYQ